MSISLSLYIYISLSLSLSVHGFPFFVTGWWLLKPSQKISCTRLRHSSLGPGQADDVGLTTLGHSTSWPFQIPLIRCNVPYKAREIGGISPEHLPWHRPTSRPLIISINCFKGNVIENYNLSKGNPWFNPLIIMDILMDLPYTFFKAVLKLCEYHFLVAFDSERYDPIDNH